MVVDMIASHRPAIYIAARDVLDLFAEAAPILTIAMATKSALLQLLL
jgi:hypothetical protein